jgi:hypothetical protein
MANHVFTKCAGLAIIALSCLSGCQPSRQTSVPLRISSDIVAGPAERQFVITTRVEEQVDGRWQTLTAPRLTLNGQQKANMTAVVGARQITVNASVGDEAFTTSGTVQTQIAHRGKSPEEWVSVFESSQQISLTSR